MENFPLMAAALLCALLFTALIVPLCSTLPAMGITVELAKKCRDMAIKSHPPPTPPGNKAYAQLERDLFAACVAKNGEMPGANASDDSKN
jgi:hypothetical protein